MGGAESMVKKSMKNRRWFLFLLLMGCCLPAASLRVAVETPEAYLHEGFILQVQVSAQGECEPPVLPALPDFKVAAHPPQHRTSSQLTIVNGRRSQSMTVETVFAYTLTPLREGTLTIPAIRIEADGESHASQPIAITVSRSERPKGITLSMRASAQTCYVGEPVMLTWTWIFDQQIFDYAFDLPVFALSDFLFPDYQPEIDPARRQQYQRLANRNNLPLIGLQQTVRNAGREQARITFSRPLLAQKAGVYQLPETELLCEIADRRRNPPPARRRAFPFDDEFFGGGRQATRRVTFRSAPWRLEVRELPAAGRPAHFSGIVGHCQVSASADPLDVQVGDPIVVTIVLGGSPFPDILKLPDLTQQADLAQAFKVSGDEPGIVKNGTKHFQRTLRANQAGINAIPAIEIPFFNTASGRYEVARSQPIPLQVRAARLVTASDLQGEESTPAVSPQAVQARSGGIAYNRGPDELFRTRAALPLFWRQRWGQALALLPPALFLLLVGGRLGAALSREQRLRRRQRQAGSLACRQLRQLRGRPEGASERVFQILQEYAAWRFALVAGTVTGGDLATAPAVAALPDEPRRQLLELFAEAESWRFAGAGTQSPERLLAQAESVIQSVEKVV